MLRLLVILTLVLGAFNTPPAPAAGEVKCEAPCIPGPREFPTPTPDPCAKEGGICIPPCTAGPC